MYVEVEVEVEVGRQKYMFTSIRQIYSYKYMYKYIYGTSKCSRVARDASGEEAAQVQPVARMQV